MNLRVALGILSLCALVQCAGPQNRSPVVSDSVAVSLFVDLHLSSARQELNLSATDQDAILAKYGLDSTGFARVMDYYAHHPDRYVAMYAQVVDRLGADAMRQMR